MNKEEINRMVVEKALSRGARTFSIKEYILPKGRQQRKMYEDMGIYMVGGL